MDTVFVVAQLTFVLPSAALACSASTTTASCRCCLLRRRNVNRRDDVVAATRLEGRCTLVFVISAASGSGTAEDQIVDHSRVAAGRSLESGRRILQLTFVTGGLGDGSLVGEPLQGNFRITTHEWIFGKVRERER